jgi:hypothetical protein
MHTHVILKVDHPWGMATKSIHSKYVWMSLFENLKNHPHKDIAATTHVITTHSSA